MGSVTTASSADVSPQAREKPESTLRFWAVQAIGGVSVLGSYASGLAAHPASDALYGTMPEQIRSFYGVTMIAAAIGYFPMMGFLLRNRRDARLFGGSGANLVDGLFAAMLLPSIVWMPATFAFLDGGSTSTALWWLVRAVLLMVALASYGLVAAIVRLRPSGPFGMLAVIGSLLFTLQTGVLDAFVWPLFMPGSLLP